MTPRILSPRQPEALARTREISLSRELTRVLVQIQRGVPLGEVERAILRRDIEAAVDLLGFDKIRDAVSGLRPSLIPIRDASFLAGLHGLPPSILSQPQVVISFDTFAALSPDRAAALDRLRLDQIQGITDETETAIRQAVRRGLERGINPRVLARELKSSIGLNTRQQVALDRFRERLVADGRPLAQIERMTARRARRMLTNRAENIARTSVLGTLNEAKRLQWDRLVAEGKLDPNEWERVWKTADDERVDCAICAPFDERTAPIGGLFTPDPEKSKPGTPASHPGPIAHPICRCVEILGLSRLRAFRLARGGSERARVLAER